MRLGGVHKLRLQDLSFFDHLPPSVYIFYDVKVYKKSIFLTTYPPLLVNVVCERPLSMYLFFYLVINPPMKNSSKVLKVLEMFNKIALAYGKTNVKQLENWHRYYIFA